MTNQTNQEQEVFDMFSNEAMYDGAEWTHELIDGEEEEEVAVAPKLVAVISKKVGSKRKSDFGAGQDTIVTIFDMSQTYKKMIQDAIELAPLLVEELTGKHDDVVIAEGFNSQMQGWFNNLNSEEGGRVAWASPVQREDGVRVIEHNKSGKQYVQGVVVASKVIEFDPNRPLPTKTRGHKNELTAVKAEFRGLANQWKMVAIGANSMIFTGDFAEELLQTIR